MQEWMEHADLSTTEIDLSCKPRADAARRLAEAFVEQGRPTPSRAGSASQRVRRPKSPRARDRRHGTAAGLARVSEGAGAEDALADHLGLAISRFTRHLDRAEPIP